MEKVASRLNVSRRARIFLTTPYRMWTRDIMSYESFVEATMNAIFQNLPAGVRSWLSGLRTRLFS